MQSRNETVLWVRKSKARLNGITYNTADICIAAVFGIWRVAYAENIVNSINTINLQHYHVKIREMASKAYSWVGIVLTQRAIVACRRTTKHILKKSPQQQQQEHQ